jgi:4-hydroxy-tetrahydrodipicolinate synthase
MTSTTTSTATRRRLHLDGIWLPLITPFDDGALDEASLTRLVRHYMNQPVNGLILAGTTGEAMTLDDEETERLVAVVASEVAGRKPIVLGLSGSDTRAMCAALADTATWPIDAYLIACPYYVRPSQDGLYRHFDTLARHSEWPIVIYNIPYRTGVNLQNEALLRLVENPLFAGIKDCCMDAAQSFDLLRHRPAGFAVMTGEDALFYNALGQGADGGILAAAHVETAAFAAVRDALLVGDQRGALAQWGPLVDLVRLLFGEPNPAPIKYWLWRQGLIALPELRLPMSGVSANLAARIDRAMAARRHAMAR